MKCIECNKNFTAKRSDAKYCSHNCQVKNYNRRKKQELEFKQQEKIALGKVQEKQKGKGLALDQQIHSIHQKVVVLEQQFNQVKEEEEITLIELKTIRDAVKESEQKEDALTTILALNDEKFYESYCNDEELRANGLGFILNGIVNVSLIGFNEAERNKEMKRARNKIAQELHEVMENQEDDKALLKELFQKLKSTKAKLKHQYKGIQLLNNKIELLKKQKLIPVKINTPKKAIQRTNLMQRQNSSNNNHLKNGVGGTELQNMTFDTFTLDSELGRFLGELDRNMTSFALTGDSGAGKSYFSFELAKVFIENGFKAKYFALEEGLGKLTQNKVRFYDLGNDITITGNGTLRDVRRDAKQYDLIVIDSFQKLNVKAEEFERLRQDFPKTIFIIIFQKTTSGSMRGGSSIKFNSSATIDVQLKDEERIAFMEKGRYGTIGWAYSIDEGVIIRES